MTSPTPKPPQTPQGPQAPEATPEQLAALAQAKEAMAKLTARLQELRDVTAYDIAAVKAPLAFAEAKLAELQGLQAQVQALPDSPEKDYAGKALKIQQRLFEGNQAMIAAQIACDQRNLEAFDKALELIDACQGNPNAWQQLQEQGLLGDDLGLAVHEEDVPYQLGRAQMNLFLGLHLWLASVDGIDGILRATDNGQAIEPRDAAEAEGRERVAEAFRQAMQADPEIARLLPGLGAELAEAFTYLEWAAPLLKAILGMPPDVQARRLADPDWKRLAGQVQAIAALLPKVQAFPALAGFFPAAREPGLPFEVLPWKEAHVAAAR